MGNENGHLREFGKFCLDAERRVLWYENEPVDLPLKEIEILCALTENGGQVVTKEELLNKVWADSFVEESNLSRHIYLLRKTFREYGESVELIKTVPRRGYRFAGEVREFTSSEIVVERVTETQISVEETSVRTQNRSWIAALIVCLAAAVSISLFILLRPAKTTLGGVRKVAVLPLTSLDASDDTNALSLGLREMLASSIGGLNGPVVQTANLGNDEADALALGKRLGVDSILSGSVQQNSGKVRVNLRLVSVESGKQLWAASFDEAADDIFKLQDAIAAQVVSSLNKQPTDAIDVDRRRAKDAEAYRAYLRGRLYFDRRNIENYQKAIAEYEKALERDPTYAAAFAGMADAYSLLANNASGNDRETFYAKAGNAALKAVELDANSSEAYASLGWIKRTHEWNWAESEKALKKAIELDPKNANAHRWLGLLLTGVGRKEEGVSELKTALEIEPLSLVISTHLGWMYFFDRRYEEAIEIFRQNLEIDPKHLPSRRLLISSYAQLGRHSDALREIETFPDTRENQHHILILKAIALRAQGKMTEAKNLLDQVAAQFTTDEAHYYLATGYSKIGDDQKALDHLERALNARDDRMVWTKVQPDFEPLANEPRFQQILKQMNL